MREECVESSKQLRSLRKAHNITQSDMAALVLFRPLVENALYEFKR